MGNTKAQACIFMAMLMALEAESHELSSQADTLHGVSSGKAGTIMLNAEEAEKPREINLGLPTSSSGTLIYEDGHLGSYQDYPVYTSHHWAGGNSYCSNSMMPLEQAVLAIGCYGNVLDTHTAIGNKGFHGKASAGTSIFGQIRTDLNINGSFGSGWYYSGGMYVNKDPSGTHPDFKLFAKDMHIFKAGIQKEFGTSKLSVLYKLSIDKNYPSGAFAAPFYYEGNGEVSFLEGFKVGRSNYIPSDDSISMMDLTTGKMICTRLRDLAHKTIHDLTANFTHRFDNGWTLDAGTHALISPNLKILTDSQGGITKITGGKTSAGKEVTLPDGSGYDGMMQIRSSRLARLEYYDVISDAIVKIPLNKHKLSVGLNDILSLQDNRSMTSTYAHTVCANPVRLSVDKMQSWDYNSSALYYSGISNIMALYAYDVFKPIERLTVKGGLRVSYQHFKVNACVNEGGEKINSRHSGFYLEDGVCRPRDYRRDNVNFGGVASIEWNAVDRLYLMAEEIYIQYPRQFVHYFTSTIPSVKPIETNLARVGLMWNNKWLDLSSQVSYTLRNNTTSTINVARDVGGVSEVRSYLAEYSISTVAWTTDLTVNYKGFSLHTMLTLQDPKYKNYCCNIQFSDKIVTYDYSGKIINNTSRVLIELDPSYEIGSVRVWASARFYGKQFANKMNNVWFNSHWETFAGVNWTAYKGFDVALSVTNVLCQSGAKGELNQADTIEDVSVLNHYLLAGSYILPFTAGLTISYTW